MLSNFLNIVLRMLIGIGFFSICGCDSLKNSSTKFSLFYCFHWTIFSPSFSRYMTFNWNSKPWPFILVSQITEVRSWCDTAFNKCYCKMRKTISLELWACFYKIPILKPPIFFPINFIYKYRRQTHSYLFERKFVKLKTEIKSAN